MTPLETITLPTGGVEIHVDPHPKSPLEASIRLGKMVFWTTRRRFREFVPALSEDEFLLKEMAQREHALHGIRLDLETITKAQIVRYFRDNYCLLQVMSHGGLLSAPKQLSSQRTGDPVGIIYCSLEDAQSAFNALPILGWEEQVHYMGSVASLRSATIATLGAEVTEYGAFVNGEVYGFKVTALDAAGEKREIHSQWGYYGSLGRQRALADGRRYLESAALPLAA
jgi:hypothetical protein